MTRQQGRTSTAVSSLPILAILVTGCSLLPNAAPPAQPNGEEPGDLETGAAIVADYGALHPDAYAGVFVDGDVLTVLIVGDVVPHEAALRARLPAGTKVAFRPARWTEAELNRLQAAISSDIAWFPANGAAFVSSGVFTMDNIVVVEISSADPAAPAKVMDHFGGQGKMRVDSDGTGVLLKPQGHLSGRVVDKAGKPVEGADIEYSPLFDAGAIAGVGHVTGPDGRFDIGQVPAGRWRVEVWANGGPIASAEVNVPPGGRGEAMIIMSGPLPTP